MKGGVTKDEFKGAFSNTASQYGKKGEGQLPKHKKVSPSFRNIKDKKNLVIMKGADETRKGK
jgi:hypothetical protein